MALWSFSPLGSSAEMCAEIQRTPDQSSLLGLPALLSGRPDTSCDGADTGTRGVCTACWVRDRRPGLGGWQTLERLKTQFPHLKN